MNGKRVLYLDQWGGKWWAKSVRELHRQIGGARPSKMYRDDPLTKKTYHTGYVVGRHWCNAFIPYEQEA
jgi:hypothetical protein